METNQELLDAALVLADFTKGMCLKPEMREAIAVIEDLRPAPKPLEGWVNVYPDREDTHVPKLFKTEESARLHSSAYAKQVHVREVLPEEPKPKAERWTASRVLALYKNPGGFVESVQRIADAHNIVLDNHGI